MDETLDEKIKPELQYEESKNPNSSVRNLMLKLMNRLGMWNHEHVVKALQLLDQGEESMLKEIAFYLKFFDEE